MLKIYEIRLEETRAALKRSLGNRFTTYSRLLEHFLMGRTTKEEFECVLRLLLNNSPQASHLHNTFVGLVLERLALAEQNALAELASVRAAMGSPGEEESPLFVPKRFNLSEILISAGDRREFTEATKRSLPVWPHSQEELGSWTPSFSSIALQDQYYRELMNIEKDMGLPLLSQLSRTLPNMVTIEAFLKAWMRTFELDSESININHIQLIQNALEEHLATVIGDSLRLTDSGYILDFNLLVLNTLPTDASLT